MSILVDSLLAAQSTLIFLLAGYEYLTLTHFPQLPPSPPLKVLPTVSIILPAKDQAETIDECVNSLVHLDYPNKEIIVVEGQSLDKTPKILAGYGESILVLKEKMLPEGWIGKNWACHQGFERARGELLLFTDGDSVHSHDSLTRTVNHLQNTEADMVTVAPRPLLGTFWEKLLQPPIFLLIMIAVGGKLVNDDKRTNALGNGQYMLFRRAAYQRIGGHNAVRGRIVEDYALARLLKSAGFKMRMVAASDSIGVRMYSSLGGIWRGWRKNFYVVSETHQFPRAILRLGLMTVFLILPFIILGYGVVRALQTPVNPYIIAGAFMAAFLWLGMLILDRSIGVSYAYALMFPISIAFYTAIGIDSTIRGALGLGFPWKGRVYARTAARAVNAATS